MEYLYSFDYYTESWIEVSSQPSSSSLSSITTDDIATTGLRVQQSSGPRRRRRTNPNLPYHDLPRTPLSTGGSSQEEYDESESESDRLMTSSNEELPQKELDDAESPAPASTTSEEALSHEEDDENSTALGVTNIEPVFTPQPNAFSHPPASQNTRYAQSAGAAGSYFPPQRNIPSRTSTQRHSYSHQRPRTHTPYNVISPSYQADHDAALRASLSTLLSCAAAARGLPKRESSTQLAAGASNRVEPSSIRIISESTLAGEDALNRTAGRRLSQTSSDLPSTQAKGKRKALSRDRRDSKKKRSGVEDMMISPTLLTWVVSAGVVVLFSAISFSAGFAYGKEVGMAEASLSNGSDGIACGREMGKGFRRLRWGTSSASISV